MGRIYGKVSFESHQFMMMMMCLFGRLHLVYGIKFSLNPVSLVRYRSNEAHRVQWKFYSVDKVQPTEKTHHYHHHKLN